MKKNGFLRKAVVYAVSTLIVCGVAGGVLLIKELWERAGEQARQEGYVAPRPVMAQEEMEALYDRHKTGRAAKGAMAGDVPAPSVEGLAEEEAEEEAEAGTGSAAYEGCPVDFEGLWEINGDVYAWITVPGTAIDYPILQHETDNSYYLNYNIDGSYGRPGCIYTENMNARDFTDNNTVIYGHNMRNGTMFAGLHQYEDASFFEENERVVIYTPEKELSYTVFAAYIYDDRHLMHSFDFANEAVYATYLEDIQGMRSLNANIREGVTVTGEDKDHHAVHLHGGPAG